MHRLKPHVKRSFVTAALVLFLSGCASLEQGSMHASRGVDHTLSPPSRHTPPEEYRQVSILADPGREEDEGIAAEPEQTIDQEIKELKKLGEWEEGEPAKVEEQASVEYDFPVTINRQVEYYLDFFQHKHRDVFARWLARSGRYLPMIHAELEESGLPLDLAYLAMIESGYNERAYSRARAVGLWQFIRATGRHFGLKSNGYIDERRDPVKSTRAAAAYLKELYAEFGSWYLAVAGYNAGEGKIRNAIRRYDTTDFWELARGRYLKLETKRYVPKLIAAIIIAKEPEKYGFGDVRYEPPLAFDTVTVGRWTSLHAVSAACGVEVDELRAYNRELRRPFTPPDDTSYRLKVPVGTGEQIAANLKRVQAIVSTEYKTHTVRRGETLTSICRRYGLTKTLVLKANTLGASGLAVGQRLRIPYRVTRYELLPEGTVASTPLAADTSGASFILHKVLPGETVSELAGRYNVPAHLIAAWNDLEDISRIRAGQQLALFIREEKNESRENASGSTLTPRARKRALADADRRPLEGEPATTVAEVEEQSATAAGEVDVTYYRVRRGDSLWIIARRFQVSVSDLKQWNNLHASIIHPGTRLQLRNTGDQQAGPTYYRVRRGDSLWTIARRHNVTMEKLRKWNNLSDDVIHPGRRLLVSL